MGKEVTILMYEDNDPRLALIGGDCKDATILTGEIGSALEPSLNGCFHLTLGVGNPFEGMLVMAEFHHCQN